MPKPTETTDETLPSDEVRARILEATLQLIDAGGRDAATTRAIAAAAGVQAPTIYRLFGDKRGLLDAVAEHALSAYVAEKAARAPHPDPVEDLRSGWDLHVAFGLAHPGLFAIMSGEPRATSPANALGLEILRRRVRNIARAGRLRVSEERAVDLLRAMGVGTVSTLVSEPEGERDPALSAAVREAAVSAITGAALGRTGRGASAAAATLRASLDETAVLSAGERHLLEELLDRIADAGSPSGATAASKKRKKH
jgi:AcrR family transcriptional regulator